MSIFPEIPSEETLSRRQFQDEVLQLHEAPNGELLTKSGFSPALTRLAIEQLEKQLKLSINQSPPVRQQAPISPKVHSPEELRKVVENTYQGMKQSTYPNTLGSGGCSGYNFRYHPKIDEEAQGDSLAIIRSVGAEILMLPGGDSNLACTSLGSPTAETIQPLALGEWRLLDLPKITDPLKSGHFKIINVSACGTVVLPCLLEYRVTALICYAADGRVIKPQTVQANPLGQVQVNCSGMTRLSYEITPASIDEMRSSRGLLAGLPKPLPDLHPYLLKRLQVLFDKGHKIRPEEEALHNANRFLNLLETNIGTSALYDANILGKTLLKMASNRGVLDLVLAYFPVGDCGFYSAFYARIYNAIGIPSWVANGYPINVAYTDARSTQFISKVPHTEIVSLLPQDPSDSSLHHSDPTPGNRLCYCNERGQIISTIKGLFDEVIGYVAAGEFNTPDQMESLVPFLKEKFLELKAKTWCTVGEQIQSLRVMCEEQGISSLFGEKISAEVKRLPRDAQVNFLVEQLKQYLIHIPYRAWSRSGDIPALLREQENKTNELAKKIEGYYGLKPDVFFCFNDLRPDEKIALFEHLKKDIWLHHPYFFTDSFAIFSLPFPDPNEPTSFGNVCFRLLGIKDPFHALVRALAFGSESWGGEGLGATTTQTDYDRACQIIGSDKSNPPISDSDGTFEQLNQIYFKDLVGLPQGSHSKDTIYAFYLQKLFPLESSERFNLILLFEKLTLLLRDLKIDSHVFLDRVNALIDHYIQPEAVKAFLSKLICEQPDQQSLSEFSRKGCFLEKAKKWLSIEDSYCDFTLSHLKDFGLTNYWKREFRALIEPQNQSFVQLMRDRHPRQTLRMLLRDRFFGNPKDKILIGGGSDDIDTFQLADQGRLPAIQEKLNQWYFLLEGDVNSIIRVARGRNNPQRLTSNERDKTLSVIKNIGDIDDHPLLKDIMDRNIRGEPIFFSDLVALRSYLGQRMSNLQFKVPIFKQAAPQKPSDWVLVDLHHLAEHPEKVQTLFAFLALKQRVGTRGARRNPLQVSLFWHDQPIQFFDLTKEKPLEESLERFFDLSCNEFSKGDIVHEFVHYWFTADRAADQLKKCQSLPQVENHYKIPSSVIPAGANQITLFVNPYNFLEFGKQLKKSGKAVIFGQDGG